LLERFFLPHGRARDTPYKTLPMYRRVVSAEREQVTMLANFVEVWLAKEGHEGEVGINLLTKIQMPNLASLYGAMLAGVDYVLMGAGIPREIPGALDAFATHEPARIKMEIQGPPDSASEFLAFNPRDHWAPLEALARPRFLAIISANSLAATLARKATGRVDGFVVESSDRGRSQRTAAGRAAIHSRGRADLRRARHGRSGEDAGVGIALLARGRNSVPGSGARRSRHRGSGRAGGDPVRVLRRVRAGFGIQARP